MPERVDILRKNRVFDKQIFRIDEVELRHELYDGTMSEPLVRLSLDRGDSAAAVVYNTVDKTVLLTEQFRYSTSIKDSGWLREIPAGMVEDEENPAKAIIRELEEETGYRIGNLTYISTFYLSPGGTSERVHLFYAPVRPTDRTESGGGRREEGEDIKVLEVPVDILYRQMVLGEIKDAKTLIGLQWLKLQPLED